LLSRCVAVEELSICQIRGTRPKCESAAWMPLRRAGGVRSRKQNPARRKGIRRTLAVSGALLTGSSLARFPSTAVKLKNPRIFLIGKITKVFARLSLDLRHGPAHMTTRKSKIARLPFQPRGPRRAELIKMALSLRRSEQRDEALRLNRQRLELLREKHGHKSPSTRARRSLGGGGLLPAVFKRPPSVGLQQRPSRHPRPFASPESARDPSPTRSARPEHTYTPAIPTGRQHFRTPANIPPDPNGPPQPDAGPDRAF